MSTRFLASRIRNQLRCWWSYALSLWGIVRVRHLPTFVSIEPANYCQLRCPECPVGQRAQNGHRHQARNMDWKTFEHIVAQVEATAHTMQFYFQGEPLLNPLLPNMITHAREAGLYTIVSTNAQALSCAMAEQLVRSGLNRIIVSIDGFSEESYQAYRVGGSLHRALEGMGYLREAKMRYQSRICIELQVLRLSSNEHEWEWIRKNYRSLGATRLVFKTAQLYDYQHGHTLMPTDERYSRYKRQADGSYKHVRKRKLAFAPVTPCYRLWSGCVITTHGEVLPCCYDKAAQYAFGSIIEYPIKQLWHNDTATTFRKQALKNSDKFAICRECNH